MKRAKHPVELFQNSIASASLVAGLLNAKYINAAPYYRMEQEFQRYGVEISRQTMANWTIKAAERYFSLIYDKMKEELLRSRIIHADKTPVKVSKDGRKAGTKSYMWVYQKGEETEQPVVIYEYQKTRKKEHPQNFLKGYQGVLCCDGYQVYHSLPEEIIICGCWAHARRHYINAAKALKGKEARKLEMTVSEEALFRIAQFFHYEKEWKDLSKEEHLKKRQQVLKPLVLEYFSWVKKQKENPLIPPKSETAKGLNYSIYQEKYLMAFLETPDVPLDNSAAERAIRSFTIGRKNFVLIDTIQGAQASAILYSIAETAKANQLKPYLYFKYLLEELPKYWNGYEKEFEKDFLKNLLPWSEQLPSEIRKTEK